MGRLAGFKYRQIVKKLKKMGFEFDRHAAGSHEIWYNLLVANSKFSHINRYLSRLALYGNLPYPFQ